jgi:hypothetical protein
MSETDGGYGVEDAAPIPPPPIITPPPRLVPGLTEIPLIAPESAVCLQCGYALRGLDTTRNCPECGAPIRNSLMGNLLEFSSKEYVGNLHRGVLLILVATLAQLVLGFLAIIALVVLMTITFSPGAAPPFNQATIELWTSVLTLPLTAVILLGWWLFSAPDPAIVGAERGQTPRTIIRITVAIMAALSVADLVVKSTAMPGMSGDLMSAGAALVIGIAGVVQFFASVLYVRWLAPRIPDVALYEKTRKYMWLLPLIYILGMICLGLGPLIAMVMYLLMLNTVSARLGDILQ